MDSVTLEDVGWVQLTIRHPPGAPSASAEGSGGAAPPQDVTLTLDCYEVHDRWVDFHKSNKDRPNAEYNAALCDFVASLGFPRPSQYVAVRFVETIRAQVERIKKNTSQPPESPASTASTPTNSPTSSGAA